MSDKKWFHKQTSRSEGEELLYKAGIDGSFIVRPSGSIQGAYALSLLFKNNVHTYRALPTEDGMLSIQTFKGVQQRKFPTIDELVENNKEAHGLVCGLTNPVGPTDLPPPVPPFPALGKPSTNRLSSNVNDNNQQRVSMPGFPLPNSVPRNASITFPIGTGRSSGPPLPARDMPELHKKIPDQIVPTNQELRLQQALLSRFENMQMMGLPVSSNFHEEIRTYLNGKNWKSDVSTITVGGSQCAQLQSLLVNEAVTLQSELNVFLEKVEFLRVLFDLSTPLSTNSSFNRKANGRDFDLEQVLGRLTDCSQVVQILNKTAHTTIEKGLNLTVSNSREKASKRRNYQRTAQLLKKIFEVKMEGALKKTTQVKVELDVARGQLIIHKPEGDIVYHNNRILQIIKHNKGKSIKLEIVFDDKKREFCFEENQQREVFCQLIQQIRNSHSKTSEPDQISIFCGTWNMGNALPPDDLSSWLLCNGSGRVLDPSLHSIPHDMYVFGTQESGMTEKEWNRKIMDEIGQIFNDNFHMVVAASLWQMRIAVIVKEEHKHRISHIKTSAVKTGIANTLGNKGAVGVSFDFGGTPFCFINSHLTSGAEKCTRRNNNYHDIISQLALGSDRFKQFYFTNRFEHIFFFGDLNYRLNLGVEDILKSVKDNELRYLQEHDQLRIEKDAAKVFSAFNEDEINFAPTYRYERGTREHYAHLKVKTTCVKTNVPSWCDRVMWKSYPEVYNISRSYGCTDDIMTSDHSPVFSSFYVGVRSQYVPKQGVKNDASAAQILLSSIEVKLKRGSGRKSFILAFHSDCLPHCEKSDLNTAMEEKDSSIELKWSKIPALKPIISDLEYLVDQHLLIGIRSEDDGDYIGECMVPLRKISTDHPKRFSQPITHKEEQVGDISGLLNISCPRGGIKEKTYEFIQIGGGSPGSKEDDHPIIVGGGDRKKELGRGGGGSGNVAKFNPPMQVVRSSYPSPTFPRNAESSSHENSPSDLEIMLAEIGMTKHATRLIESGWDDLQFIKDMNDADLREAGVRFDKDRATILERIQRL